MQQTQTESEDRQSDDQPAFQNYMPGMPRASSEPGPVERFLTRLFRPRGEYRVRVRRE
jgi:hypothetical protein